MKRKRKGTVLLLAGAMAGVLTLSACAKESADTNGGASAEGQNGGVNTAGFPIVKDQASFTVFGCKDPNQAAWKDVLVFKEYEKKSNVHMDFQETPSQGCAEKKNLLFASNELPDLFLRAQLTNDDLAKYGMQEKQLIPLEGLIDQYAPNLKSLFEQYPDEKKAITAPDGHIYALPQMRVLGSERSEKIWINKDWLQKLNLQAPTNVEELKKVLVAFRDQDPNGNGKKDEIPLGLRDMGMVFSELTGSWGLDRQLGYNINIDNDKVHIWVADDRFKDMLMFLNEMYKENLLWADFYKGDIPKWRSNLSQANFGMFFIQASDPFINVENQFTGMAPIKGPFGDQKFVSAQPIASPTGTFAITKVNKNPEAAMRWVDYFYGDEGSLFFRFGVEGQTYEMKDGKPVMKDSVLNDSRGVMAAMGDINLVPGGGFPHLVTEKTGGLTNNEKVMEVYGYVEKYIPQTIYGAPIFDKAASEKILSLRADIDKYVNESVAKFILGELSFDRWDAYVNTLKKMQLDELEKAYQQAYDTMKQ
ncbi:extracellular solute-binding protein [Cohnella zeiphila]|uniref:Extracellular solute-binding protein n=1 Tax=Cohnella zeiphila TaxID=2761120 RepID=A0A7X0SJS0_9BACL|nr:extracellular solute-binding protein [Cohnella zeiphila]MBB6731236.1 extracellular solute-binding protein [Cohnella zeiphila]